MGVLIGVFSIAVFEDIRRYKIPNACIIVGMAVGFMMSYRLYSAKGVFLAAVQAVLIFTVLYPFYLIRGLGAGDVKLIMVMGCALQGRRLLDSIMVMMILAGFASLVKIGRFREGRQRLFYLVRYIRKAVVTGALDEYEIDTSQQKSVIRLSIPALLSLALMYIGVY